MERAFSERFMKFLEIINRAGYYYFSDEIKEELLAAQQYAGMAENKSEYNLNYLLSDSGQIEFAIRFIHDRFTVERKMREECDNILKKTFKLNVNAIEFSDPQQNERVNEIKLRRINEKDIARWDELARKIEAKLIGS
ncbi:hypothetical protein [Pectobacterium versatile]|uniref:hypothetical protein n=1 Tax=Pectobacterium versatile TaxID=2488639 RepID=UPI002B253C99|nr:hypothetical protein [Pectobacterium versatile]